MSETKKLIESIQNHLNESNDTLQDLYDKTLNAKSEEELKNIVEELHYQSDAIYWKCIAIIDNDKISLQNKIEQVSELISYLQETKNLKGTKLTKDTRDEIEVGDILADSSNRYVIVDIIDYPRSRAITVRDDVSWQPIYADLISNWYGTTIIKGPFIRKDGKVIKESEESISPQKQKFIDYCKDKLEVMDKVAIFDMYRDKTVYNKIMHTPHLREFDDLTIIADFDTDLDNLIAIDNTNTIVIDTPMINPNIYAGRMEFDKIDKEYYNMLLKYWDDLYMDENIEDAENLNESEEPSLIKSYQETDYGYHNNESTIYGELNDGNWYVYIPGGQDFFEIYNSPITKEYLDYLYRDEDDEEQQAWYDNFIEEHEITKNYDYDIKNKIISELDYKYYGDDFIE